MAAQQVNEDGTELGKGFYGFVGQKRPAKESIPPLLSGKGGLATEQIQRRLRSSVSFLPQSSQVARILASLNFTSLNLYI